MSKPIPRKKQKKKLPIYLIVLAISGLMLILVALVLSNQPKDEFGTPILAVDQTRIDYGDVKFNTNKTFTFQVTNNGDGILRFKEKPYIQVLEGC